MAAPILSSVSPLSGPPGTAVICLGSGFDAGAQVGCPGLVATTFVSATELHASIPADLEGLAGSSVVISIIVFNEDGSSSAALPFTVRFGQTWTTVQAVCGEVPQFKRGGTIPDTTIDGWIWSIAQAVNAAMLGRGLSMDPGNWAQPAAGALEPDPASVLELIVRYGAAARLASVVGSQFAATGEWGLAKTLRADFDRELKALAGGAYDKIFRPGAATVETGTLVGGGDIATSTGDADQAFSKGQVF
jgi:hypothetical protein